MGEASKLFLAVTTIAFLLRLPFLDAGYGWDSDAWRVASASAAMAQTGEYAASRLPGNPVHDVAMALLWSLGPWARTPRVLNGASALVSALGAGAFALAWWRLGPGSVGRPRTRDAALAGIAAASVPAVFVASVSTLDYAWGFAFVAAALAAAASGRATLAGAFGALAVGTRLSSAVCLLGVGLVLMAPGRRPGTAVLRALLFTAAWTLVGLLSYLPLWIGRGLSAIRWYEHAYPPLVLAAKKVTVDLWGWVGFLAWCAVMATALVRRAWSGGEPRPADPADVPAARVVTAGAAAAWLRLPYKATYLVPAVPLVLRAHAALGPRAVRALLAALVVSPWVLSVQARDPATQGTPSSWAWTVDVLGNALVVDARGPILHDRDERRAQLAYGARIAAAARSLPPGSALVVQDWLPMLRLLLDRVRGPVEKDGVLYTHLLDRPELERLRNEGRTLFYLPGVELANRARFDVDLIAAGARPLVP